MKSIAHSLKIPMPRSSQRLLHTLDEEELNYLIRPGLSSELEGAVSALRQRMRERRGDPAGAAAVAASAVVPGPTAPLVSVSPAAAALEGVEWTSLEVRSKGLGSNLLRTRPSSGCQTSRWCEPLSVLSSSRLQAASLAASAASRGPQLLRRLLEAAEEVRAPWIESVTGEWEYGTDHSNVSIFADLCIRITFRQRLCASVLMSFTFTLSSTISLQGRASAAKASAAFELCLAGRSAITREDHWGLVRALAQLPSRQARPCFRFFGISC